MCAVWPDWAIFCTLGIFLKPLAPINLPKSPTCLGNFCKGVKIHHFWATFIEIWRFFWSHWMYAPTMETFSYPSKLKEKYSSILYRLTSQLVEYPVSSIQWQVSNTLHNCNLCLQSCTWLGICLECNSKTVNYDRRVFIRLSTIVSHLLKGSSTPSFCF